MVVAQHAPHGRLGARGGWATDFVVSRWAGVDDVEAQAVVDHYYIDTASTAERAATNLARDGGGLGEYYSECETRAPCGCWPGTLTPPPGWSALRRAAHRRYRGCERGGALARRRGHVGWCAGARIRRARCARVRSDILRTQERVPGARAESRAKMGPNFQNRYSNGSSPARQQAPDPLKPKSFER
jgi:hypothetical protein